MRDFLFHFHPVQATTWAYLSSLMIIALYFKFSRLWSVRNFDILCLILFAPGLLLVKYGQEQIGVTAEQAVIVERAGFIWLFAIGAVFLIRLLLDPLMVRRPLIEPNLSVGGSAFACISLLMFLLANVVTGKALDPQQPEVVAAAESADPAEPPVEKSSFEIYGPGFPLLYELPRIAIDPTVFGGSPENVAARPAPPEDTKAATIARALSIVSHLAVVLGIVAIGYRHFGNIKTGIAAATLYLLLPYTARSIGFVDHVLPAGLLIWAIASYRRPLLAGTFVGLAIGVIYYPIFLLPLWLGFYWQRGLIRFLIGAAVSLAVLVGVLAYYSADQATFIAGLFQMFGWRPPVMENLGGLWQYLIEFYRIPVLAAYAVLCVSFAIWPAPKNLGSLISCSAVVMLATQFWHPYGGGLYVAWFLPLLLLTIFRPNLEDRVALSVLHESWFHNRKSRDRQVERAA